MNEQRIRELMELAITQAEASRAEGERADTPLVGAVLADTDGKVLIQAHRGEFKDEYGDTKGVHAEYVIFEKAKRAGIDVRGKVLFTTLEPCTKRSPEKTPCAVRVANSGVSCVYVGDIDPNPDVRGLGETYVSLHTRLERFPSELAKRLRAINHNFWELHRHQILFSVSMWAAPGASNAAASMSRPLLARDREPLLHQSLDLISRSGGDIMISAGDMSWLQEVQIGLLRAVLTKRNVRVLCAPVAGKVVDHFTVEVMRHLGVDVSVYQKQDWPVRATISRRDEASISMAFLENSHAALYETPDDAKLVETIRAGYERCWREGMVSTRLQPEVIPISDGELVDALRRGVPQYGKWNIAVEEVPIDGVLLLPKALEQFKLFRNGQLELLRTKFDLPRSFRIKGSPWPCTIPVFEKLKSGQMVVLDGAHRVYWALQNGERAATVVVVDNPQYDLPATPMGRIEDIRPMPKKLPREDRYNNYKKEVFRPIRAAFRTITGV